MSSHILSLFGIKQKKYKCFMCKERTDDKHELRFHSDEGDGISTEHILNVCTKCMTHIETNWKYEDLETNVDNWLI